MKYVRSDVLDNTCYNLSEVNVNTTPMRQNLARSYSPHRSRSITTRGYSCQIYPKNCGDIQASPKVKIRVCFSHHLLRDG